MESNLINLQLGDIIKIYAPKNDILHEEVFYIKYISSDEINIINDTKSETVTIQNNTITDHSITQIDLLYRNPHKEYTKQNKLIEGTWVNIHFGGSEPFILIGLIEHIEGDCIEVKKYPTNEVYYINFDYKGLPKWMNIEKIEIREHSPLKEKRDELGKAPKSNIIEESKGDEESKEQGLEQGVEQEVEEGSNIIEDEYLLENDYEDMDEMVNMDNILKNASDLVILEDLDSITQIVNVTEKEKRFGIDIQTNDLYNTLILSNNDYKTKSFINNIHTIVRRFTELREEYSDFDSNMNPQKPKLKGPAYKPIIDKIKYLKEKIKWFIPVVRRKKKIYQDKNYNNYDDVKTYSEIESIQLMNEEIDELNTYKNKLVSKEDNIYYSYLNLIDEIYNINIGDENEELYTMDVKNNIEAIVNNHGNFLSSAINNEILNNESKYVFNTYCKTLDYLVQEPLNVLSLENRYSRKNDNNEKMNIESYINLPLDVINHSRLHLHSSNILEKANLSQFDIQYYKFLKNNIVNQEYIADLDNEEELSVIYNGKTTNNILKTTNNFIFNSESENYHKNFEKYLDKIVPKTKKIFHMMKENMKDVYSLNNILLHLEPLFIYNKDISFKQYVNFIYFIRDQVNKYNTITNEQKLLLGKYNNSFEKTEKRRIKRVGDVISHELNNIINDAFNKNNVTNSGDFYNIDGMNDGNNDGSEDDRNVNSTMNENIKNMFDVDMGYNLFYTLSKENLHLLSNTSVNKVLNYFSEKYKKTNDNEEGKCNNYIIAKKYYSEEDIDNENNVQLFFDKEYDDTVYDILDVYNEERKKRDPADFKIYLKNKLKEINNISDSDAEYYMETLLRGKKEIKNGHYAIYSYMDQETQLTLYKYYKRDKDEWILDAKLTEERKEEYHMLTGDNNCNVDKDCINTNDDYFKIKTSFNKNNDAKLQHSKISENNSECVENEEDVLKHEKKIVERMIAEYDHAHYLNKEKCETFINNKQNYHNIIYQKMKEIKMKDIYKYENFKNQLGSLYNPLSEELPSPYQDLLDTIISEDDDSTKYNNLLLFSKRFTREATINENTYWNYCIETNVKILPTFMIKIASDFEKNGFVRRELLDYLCKTQGEKSEDGDSFVDIESGKIIMYNIKNGDEEYDDKHSKITREDIEKDNELGETEIIDLEGESNLDYNMVNELMEGYMNNNHENDDKKIEKLFLEGTIKYVTSLYELLVSFIKIAISDETKKFIIFHTNAIYISNFSTQDDNDISAKNKVILTYVFLSVFLIGTQIQNAKLKKTYPGCVGKFEGYPLIQTADHDGISYLSCFIVDISKSSKKNNPFYLLNKTSKLSIEKNIKEVLTKYTLVNSLINTKILKRREELDKQQMIPTEMKMSNWSKFKPPLFPYKIKIVKNFTEQYMKDMRKKMDSNEEKGLIYLNQIKSKIYELSTIFHNIINNVISKQILTLKSNMYFEPFVENSCCETIENNSVIEYFNQSDASLIPYSEMIKTNSAILKKYSKLLKPKTGCLKPNNITLPVLEFTNFDEKTIYTAFIHYCKWSKENNNLMLKSDLLSICELKEEIFKKDDELDVKISKLKEQGKVYNNKMLLVLLKRINNENKIQLDFDNVVETNIDMFTNYLTSIESTDIHFNNIKDKILNLTNTFDISMKKDQIFKENIILKNTIMDVNDGYIKDISNFLKTHGSINSIKYKKIFKFLKNLNNPNMVVNNDIYVNMITDFKVNINNYVNIYSNIIMNKLDYYLDKEKSIPKHWMLTETHNKLINNVQTQFYNKFTSFYNLPYLKDVLFKIKENGLFVNHLSKLTPIYLEHNNDTISILDKQTIISMYVYYTLKILHLHISNLDEELSTDTEIILLKEKISSLLINYIELLMNSHEHILLDADMIMEKILTSKEKEKMKIIEKLEGLTDEQIEIENELKNAKLGKWSKGLDKALIVHDGKVFDSEIAEQTDVYIMADENERNDISFMDGEDGDDSYDNF